MAPQTEIICEPYPQNGCVTRGWDEGIRVCNQQPVSRVVRSKKVRTEVIEVPVVHHEVRMPIEVEVPVEVPYEVSYEVAVPYEVTREVFVPVERVVENIIEHRVEVTVPYPEEYETIVEKVVEKRVQVPGPVKYVEKIVEVERIVEVEKPVERIHEIPVPYPVEKVVEKVVKVPQRCGQPVREVRVPHHVDRVVERRVPVPYDQIVERQVTVPVERVIERIEHQECIREVPVYVERVVERVVERAVPVDKVIERKVPVPIEKVVEIEKPRYVQKVIEKIVHVPYEKVTERRVEVPFERIVHIPVERIVEKHVEVPLERYVEKVIHVPTDGPSGPDLDRVVWRDVPVVVERVVPNEIAASPFLFKYANSAAPPHAPHGWKWAPFGVEDYDEVYKRFGQAHMAGPAETANTPTAGGQLNIIDRFIYVDPSGNVVDEKAEMWTETGLDPLTMQHKMVQAQRAGFHRSDPFWDQHFDEFASMAARQPRSMADSPYFDHPVELNYHGMPRPYA